MGAVLLNDAFTAVGLSRADVSISGGTVTPDNAVDFTHRNV